MTNAEATTVSRRSLLARLLVAAVALPMVGVRLVDPVAAGKKKRKSKQQRVDAYKRTCETNGGTATIDSRPGGTTVSCSGATDPTSGDQQDWTCTVYSKGSRCHSNLTNPPAPNAGGGGTAPPGGGNENPTGGANPGGGAHVPPTGGIDPDGGGSGPVLE